MPPFSPLNASQMNNKINNRPCNLLSHPAGLAITVQEQSVCQQRQAIPQNVRPRDMFKVDLSRLIFFIDGYVAED